MDTSEDNPQTAASPAGGAVLSITDRIKQQQLERLYALSAKTHDRELELFVCVAEHQQHLDSVDYDALVDGLSSSDDPDAPRKTAELRCVRAWQLCRRGDVDAGQAEWDAVAAEFPDLAAPHTLRGRWIMITDAGEAIAHFDKAASLAPTDSTIYERRGDCYREIGDHERAIANYRRALSLNPDSIDAFKRMGNALVAAGKPAEAIVCYDQAIARAPRYTDFYADRALAYECLAKYDAALRDFDRVLVLDPTNKVGRIGRARCLVEGDENRAIATLEAVMREIPDELQGPYLLGRIFLKQERFAEAIYAFSRAIELAPDHADAIGQRGIALARQKDIERGIADLRKAHSLDPLIIEYACALQVLLRNTGDAEGAIELLEGLIERFPEIHVFYKDRASAYRDLGRHAEALADYEKAYELNPDDADLLVWKASVLTSLERWEPALSTLEIAIQFRPDDAIAYALAAFCHEQLEHDDALIEAELDKSVALMPQFFQTRFVRGVFFLDRDRWAEAIAEFDRAIELKPSDANGYYHRAYCRSQLRQETIAAFKEGEVEDPVAKEDTLRACVADFEKALELGYPEEAIYIELCSCLTDLGDLYPTVAMLEIPGC